MTVIQATRAVMEAGVNLAFFNFILADVAIQYYMENTGPVQEKDYPYKGYDNTCRVDPSKSVFDVLDYYLMDGDSETEMVNLLYETGPLSVCLNADPLQFY